MSYQLALFDLDGTLMDTSSGIINSYQKAAAHFGYSSDHITSYQNIIGGALPDNFRKYFYVDEGDIRGIVEYYRTIYAEEGIYMAKHYEGIQELLAYLKARGTKVAVATLKRQDFAERMMNHFGLGHYFDYICGMDAADTKSKADIIRQCQKLAQISSAETVMVGDTIGDQKGAYICESDFIGVLYGFGFRNAMDTEQYPCKFIAQTPEEIEIFLR